MDTEKRNKNVKLGKGEHLVVHEDTAETNDLESIEAIVRRAIKVELNIFKSDMEKWFVEKIGIIEKRVGTLQLDITHQSKDVVDLRRENVNLQKQITNHSNKLEELESYSKCDNLIIRGLPETLDSIVKNI